MSTFVDNSTIASSTFVAATPWSPAVAVLETLLEVRAISFTESVLSLPSSISKPVITEPVVALTFTSTPLIAVAILLSV